MIKRYSGVLHTIGHSNITYEEFLAILDLHEIKLLVDVRSHPGSKRVPWTNSSNLSLALAGRYRWMPELGGPTEGVYSDPKVFPKHHIGLVRPEFKKIPKEQRPHSWWNRGLFDFAEWMGKDPKLLDGMQTLQTLVDLFECKVAIMCSEVLWWKCHRQMLSDLWVACGGQVSHIMGKKVYPHPSGPALEERLGRYEPETQKLWS